MGASGQEPPFDQLRLAVGLEPAVRLVAVERAHGVLRGLFGVLAQLLRFGDAGVRLARLLLGFVGELLRLAVRFLGDGARRLGRLVREPFRCRQLLRRIGGTVQPSFPSKPFRRPDPMGPGVQGVAARIPVCVTT